MEGRNLPQEVIDKICDFVDASDHHFDSRYHFQALDTVPTHRGESQRDLANLRIASRTTCEAANPHFFRHFDARCPAKRRGKPSADWRHALLNFSTRSWVKYVHTLRIGAGKGDSDFGERYLPDESALVASAYVVPVLARGCSALRAISVDIVAADMGFTQQSQPTWQRNLLLLTIENTLREAPSTLKTLEISLPLTADYWALHQSISKSSSLLSRLSSLTSVSVRVNDSTGPGGTRYSEKPLSDSQRRFPNEQHQSGLWKFLRLAPTLRALCVQCTHVLNFDHMSATSFEGLEELKLTNVAISGSLLARMARTSTRSLQAMELVLVQLNSGTWAEVLRTFCEELHNLINFYIHSCSYSATGSSSQYHQGMLPEIDNPRAIEGLHWDDTDELGAMQRHVNALRAARSLELYPDHEYRFLDVMKADEETG